MAGRSLMGSSQPWSVDTSEPSLADPSDPSLADPSEPSLADPLEPEPFDRSAQARLIVVLGLLVAIAPLTIDMYLPALPAVAADLRTSAAAVQLTLTGTLAGLAIGQLTIGPL